jgi:hypothetical protein
LDSCTRTQNHHLFHLLQPNSQEPPCWDWPQQQGRTQSCSHIPISKKKKKKRKKTIQVPSAEQLGQKHMQNNPVLLAFHI